MIQIKLIDGSSGDVISKNATFVDTPRLGESIYTLNHLEEIIEHKVVKVAYIRGNKVDEQVILTLQYNNTYKKEYIPFLLGSTN